MISIVIEDQAVQSILNSLSRRMDDMTPVMREIGEALVEGTKQRFDSASGWDGVSWAPNSKVTILRYLGLTKGNYKKDGSVSKKGARAAAAKKPLTGETKSLRSTIAYQASRTGVTIGSPMEYAATQQLGAMRGAFGRTRRNAPIPWGNIPPRPFLPMSSAGGMSTSAARLVMDIMSDYITPK